MSEDNKFAKLLEALQENAETISPEHEIHETQLTPEMNRKFAQTMKAMNMLLNESGLAPREQVILVYMALQLMQQHFGIEITGMNLLDEHRNVVKSL